MEILKENELDLLEQEGKVYKNLKKLFNSLLDVKFIIDSNNELDLLENKNTKNFDVAYISVTDKCNLKCKHCIVFTSDDNELSEMSLEEFKEVLNILLLEKNPREINITGGEPLLNKNIVDILEYLRENYSGVISLSTNATLLDEIKLNMVLKNVDLVSISLDGYNKESCENVRGKGVFDKVINNIEILKEKGFEKISLSMTNTNYTIGNEDKFNKLCEKLDVKPIIRNFTAYGRGKDNRDELLTISEKIYDSDISLKCRLCKPGIRETFICANGDVYPCGSFLSYNDLCLGNIFKDGKNIFDINFIDNLIEKYRPWNNQKCKDCEVNLFCHSCIAYINSLQEDEKSFEKFCKIEKEALNKVLWEN